MVETIIYCSDPAGEATTSGSQTFQSIIGEIIDTTTENNHKYRARSAGTLSQMYMRVTAISGGTVICKTRKNGADGGQTMSVTATGEWEDTSGTDSLDGDDEINYALNTAAAAQTITVRLIQMLFDATTNTVSLMGLRIASAFTTASTTFFKQLGGGTGTTAPAENAANCRQRKAGTFKRIGVFTVSNTRTATTFKSRKNDADGAQSVSITASGNGWFEDTTNTDTVGVGEDWNFAWVHGTGTNSCTYQVMKIEFESTDGDGQIINATDSASQSVVDNTTRHFTLGGMLNDTISASTDLRAETNLASVDFSQLNILVLTNSASNTSTVTLQKDGADTTLIASVTADATGNFTDTSNTVNFTAGQETSIEITVPTEGGTNSLAFKSISVWSNIVDLTRITKDVILKWNIEQRITKALTLKWNIIGRITKTLTLKWHMINFITKNLVLKWNIIGRITKPLTLKWNIIGRITKDVILKWNIIGRITKDLILKWNILSRITKDLILKWNILGRITKTLTLKWHIQQRITKTLTLKWDLLADLERVTKDLILKWNIVGRITKTVTLKWHITNLVTKTLTLKWNIIGRITKALTLKWHIQQRITKDLILKWNIIGRITKNLTLKWNIIGRITKNLTLKWDILEEGLTRITKDIILKWNIQGRITKNVILKWHIINRITKDVTLKWNILSRITKTLTLKWHITNFVVKTLTLKWNILGRVTKTLTLVWSILSEERVIIFPGSGPISVSKGEGSRKKRKSPNWWRNSFYLPFGSRRSSSNESVG